MKSTLISAIASVLAMLMFPLLSLETPQKTAVSVVVDEDVPYNDNTQVQANGYDSFRILVSGEVTEISADEYIFGVVAAEMPAAYHEEALKAQAVAAYTFACHRKASREDEDYDLTDDPETDQCYITRAQAIEKWGDGGEEYAQKLDRCIAEIKGQFVTYKGTIAQTVYHAISSGVTVSAAEVWGNEVPYLIPVDSMGDKLANGYLSEVVFTAEQLAEALNSITAPTGDPQGYFSDISLSDSGRVVELCYCGKTISGSELSKALSLRSSNFEVSYGESGFTFNVKGYGHGVGMSQNGANFMAKQGSSYEEILLHYYTGCKIEKN